MITRDELQVAQLFRDLFRQIENGDAEHRAWLRDKIEMFISTEVMSMDFSLPDIPEPGEEGVFCI